MQVFKISIFLLKGQILSLATSLPVLTFALTIQKPQWCLSRVSDSHLDWQSRQWEQRQIQFHLNRFMMKQWKLLVLLNINMVLKIFFIMKWQVCALYGCCILSQQWWGGVSSGSRWVGWLLISVLDNRRLWGAISQEEPSPRKERRIVWTRSLVEVCLKASQAVFLQGSASESSGFPNKWSLLGWAGLFWFALSPTSG